MFRHVAEAAVIPPSPLTRTVHDAHHEIILVVHVFQRGCGCCFWVVVHGGGAVGQVGPALRRRRVWLFFASGAAAASGVGGCLADH